MKRFTCTIEENSLEKAIDLKGWSHCGPQERRSVSWYPFEGYFRRIWFTAKHRTAACMELDRLGLLVRDLSDGTPVKQ